MNTEYTEHLGNMLRVALEMGYDATIVDLTEVRPDLYNDPGDDDCIVVCAGNVLVVAIGWDSRLGYVIDASTPEVDALEPDPCNGLTYARVVDLLVTLGFGPGPHAFRQL